MVSGKMPTARDGRLEALPCLAKTTLLQRVVEKNALPGGSVALNLSIGGAGCLLGSREEWWSVHCG